MNLSQKSLGSKLLVSLTSLGALALCHLVGIGTSQASATPTAATFAPLTAAAALIGPTPAGGPAPSQSDGQRVQYEYDALGRLTQVSYQDGSKVNYTYDAAGNILTIETTDSPPVKGPGD